MRSRQFLNALLLAMTLVLIWAASQTPEQQPADTGIYIFDQPRLKPEEVHRIRLQSPGHGDIRLSLDHGRWWLRTPLKARADAGRAAALRDLAAVKSANGFRANGNDLGQYALELAAAVLWLNDRRLDIGAREPLSGLRYVLSGAQVHLIADSWSNLLFADALDFVSPRLLARGLTPMALHLPGGDWVLHRGHWRREPPDSDSDTERGAALASAWSRASALVVQAFDPGLPWRGSVRLGLDSAPGTVEFAVAQTAGALYLGRRDRGLQYQLPVSRTADLLGTE